MLSQLWSLEGQDQGDTSGESVPGFPLLVTGGFMAIWGVPWLVEASPQSLPSSSPGLLPVCGLVQFSLSYKDTNHIGLGPTHMSSFKLEDLCKDPISK